MNRARWLPELDGVRGLACLVVVLSHFHTMRAASWSPWWQQLELLVSGNAAVFVFFVLSGFLLTYLAVIEHRGTGRLHVRAFFLRRIVRIWPLHFFVITTVLVLIAPSGLLAAAPETWDWVSANAWSYYAFIANWRLALREVGYYTAGTPMLSILWSVAIEEQIYVVFPFVLLTLLGMGGRQRLRLIVAIVVLSTVIRVLAYTIWMPPYVITPSYFDVMLAGGVGGWLLAHSRLRGLDGVVYTGQRYSGWLALGGLAVLLLSWRFIREMWAVLKWGTWFEPLAYPLMAAGTAYFLLWLVEHRECIVSRVLRWRPLRFLGTISYGWYLWHFVVREVAERQFQPLRPPDQAATDLWVLTFLAAYLAGGVLVSSLSYFVIERPFLQLRRRFRSGAHEGAVAAVNGRPTLLAADR